MTKQKLKVDKVNGRKFTYEIILSKGIGRLTKKSESMIIELVTNAIKKSSYTDPEDELDAIQTSYLNILTNWQNFNPDKTNNAFAYFTEIHKRSIAESLNIWYVKKGFSKDENKYIKHLSIDTSNDGNAMHNI